ncbi:MAG: DegQ family serine endoprotease [Alphaproteobacteria bacterium]
MKHSFHGAAMGLLVALIAAIAAAPAQGAQNQVPSSRQQIKLSFAPLVKKVAPAVVNIHTRKVVRQRTGSLLFSDPFFRRFFGDNFPLGRPRERVQTSLGSGVIVDASGLIVTNYHVIKGSDEITVGLSDRRSFSATIELTDEQTDLAVLRIDAGSEKLPFLKFRDSDDLEVGDLLLAIGNPFGVGQTVTSGIVSALARTTVGVSDFRFFIQTDAAINPGNSGGALVTMDGRLVGINTAIYSRSGGSVGVGFAIPSNMVAAVIAGIATGGRVVRPWLGATGQTVTPDIAAIIGLARPAGVLINDINANSPAGGAGLWVGDVITAVNGRAVDDPQALRYRLATLTVGKTAELTVWRKGKPHRLTMALVPPPEIPPRNTTTLKGAHPFSGATVANLSPALVEELALPAGRKGVIVLKVARGSIGARFGVRPADNILNVNGHKIASVKDLRHALDDQATGWSIRLRRGDQVMRMVINR